MSNHEYDNNFRYSAQIPVAELNDSNYIEITNIINDIVSGVLFFKIQILILVSVMATIGFFRVKTSYVPMYETSASFFVDVNYAVSYDNDSYFQATMQQVSKSFPYIISNNVLRIMIADDLGLPSVPGTIRTESLSDTNLITLYVDSYSPQMSYDILQSVLKNYSGVAKSVIGNTQLIMIEESEIPTKPVNPDSSRRMAAIFALVGLFFCIILIFGYSILKKTVRKEEDFKDMLNIRCFGSVPLVRIGSKSKRESSAILFNQRRVGYEFGESIRTLRTRLEMDQKESGAKVYMISSSLPEEGKSTIAVNLSKSLADYGKKVILVDMDVRNPSILKILGWESLPKGLADLINEEASLDEILINGDVDNLSVLVPGNTYHKAVAIINSPKIPEVLEELRKKADYIILDTAPSGLLSDASFIAGYADACLYVVCQDFAPVDIIKEGIDMLTESNLRIAGCILNQAENGIMSYGTGYGYGYGYGYYGSHDSYSKYNNPIT